MKRRKKKEKKKKEKEDYLPEVAIKLAGKGDRDNINLEIQYFVVT